MLERVGTLLIVAGLILTLAARADSQDNGLEERILHPTGTQTRPILLQPTIPRKVTSPIPPLPIISWVTFSLFMRQVEEANLFLAAQRYNVPIAEAQLRAAAVFPDPTLQAAYAGDASGNGQVSTYSASLGEEFLLGGKRHYRKDAASAALLASSATLSDFKRNLRAQAAEAFIDGLTNDLKARRKEETLERAQQLVELIAKELSERKGFRRCVAASPNRGAGGS